MKLINKNKWNITGVFLIAFFIVMLLILSVNFILLFSSIMRAPTLSSEDPEKFTRDFKAYIEYKNDLPYLKTDGINELNKKNSWIQFLGEDFKEVSSFNKPKSVPESYNPLTLIHEYKYDVENYSVFIGESKCGNKTYSYLIGLPIEDVAKHTVVFSPTGLRKTIGGLVTLFCFDIIIAVVVAYLFFSKKMGKAIDTIIVGIKELSMGNYDKNYKEEGIYKDVFKNLNKLNRTLNENKIKRIQLDNMRDNWISSISHDVKTPLSSIKGYAEIMKDTDYNFSDEEIKEYSNIIWEKASYIQVLVEDLNFTYKIKNGSLILNKTRVNLKELLQNIIIEILNHPLYSKRNITFNYEAENMWCDLDENLMRRAINNLIFNAIIHNNEDVDVEVSLYGKDNSINILIKDTGKGISEEDLPYVFDRYYRGTNTSCSTEGSGLGMAISKQIIDIHGGNIYVESEVSRGASIIISVPL